MSNICERKEIAILNLNPSNINLCLVLTQDDYNQVYIIFMLCY